MRQLFFIIYILLLLINSKNAENLDPVLTKRTFCGRKLISILGQFCTEFPMHENDYLFRTKRHITNECCRNKCSLNYLLENYCEIINTTALQIFKEENDISQNIISIPTSTQKGILSRTFWKENKLGSMRHFNSNSQENINHVEKEHIKRNQSKRENCNCYKLLKLKKFKRERRLWRILTHKKFAMQEPQIGGIEEHQRPFYVIFS